MKILNYWDVWIDFNNNGKEKFRAYKVIEKVN